MFAGIRRHKLVDVLSRRVGNGYFRRRAIGFFQPEHFVQLTGVEHLSNNVATTHKLAIHVQLRNGGPITEHLDPFANQVILQHVVAGVITFEQFVKHPGGARRKAALGHLWRAFHVQNDAVGCNLGSNLFLCGRTLGHLNEILKSVESENWGANIHNQYMITAWRAPAATNRKTRPGRFQIGTGSRPSSFWPLFLPSFLRSPLSASSSPLSNTGSSTLSPGASTGMGASPQVSTSAPSSSSR